MLDLLVVLDRLSRAVSAVAISLTSSMLTILAVFDQTDSGCRIVNSMSVSELEISLCESVSWRKKLLALICVGLKLKNALNATSRYLHVALDCNNSFSAELTDCLVCKPDQNHFKYTAAPAWL